MVERQCLTPQYCSEGAELQLSMAQREQVRSLLQGLAEQLPQLHMEGEHNVWILKPGAASRGRGRTGGGANVPHVPWGPHMLPYPQASCARRG